MDGSVVPIVAMCLDFTSDTAVWLEYSNKTK